MRALDAQARGFEIANLPDETFPVLRTLGREEVAARVQACGPLLAKEHALAPAQRQRLPKAAVVPDDYITSRRTLGLYAISGMPFASGERSWQRHTEAVFARQRRAPPPDPIAYQRYVPREQPMAAGQALAQSRAVMAASPRDVLGVPQIDAAGAPAPVRGVRPQLPDRDPCRIRPLRPAAVDRPARTGRPRRRALLARCRSVPAGGLSAAWPSPATARPVLPQLVYTIWFSERPMQESGDLLGGRLDGLVWRVTLDEQGEPLIYDTIQPSGRFAMFFPTARLRVQAARRENDPLAEWAFSPIRQPVESWLGATAGLAGVSLRVESQTHQLVGIGLPGATWGEPVASNAPYRTVDYDRLRALPLPGRGSRSIFGADGVVPYTERSARYFFWPMGIARPGSMRQ